MLEIAILGLLNESPMHGYELRKRLSTLLGAFRAFSYGSLYPRSPAAGGRLDRRGGAARSATGRCRLRLPAGQAGLQAHRRGQGTLRRSCWPRSAPRPTTTRVSAPGWPSSPRPGPTSGCRSSKAAAADTEQADGMRTALARTRERLDRYTLQLQEHGLESVDREVRWLSELIETERGRKPAHTRRRLTHDQQHIS